MGMLGMVTIDVSKGSIPFLAACEGSEDILLSRLLPLCKPSDPSHILNTNKK